jgi:hypothetical protein
MPNDQNIDPQRSRLLSLPGEEVPDLLKPCDSLIVARVRYRHSAACFWPRLIDEVRQVFPGFSRIELTSVTSESIDPMRLDPQRELENDIQDLLDKDLEQVISQTITELEMFGAPPPVQLRVMETSLECYSGKLPPDSVDAETLTYLVAWLLEWGRVPYKIWNRDALDAQFVARDPDRSVAYHISFTIIFRHLSEGLYRRTIDIRPTVAPTQ